MSIIVKNVSKQYGSQWALDNVSFEIPKGQIVGFLGPNGAGKSTMMKIITSFIPSTSGKVEVNGFDVATKSMDSRRIIGYLPEHNPLYLEMYVREYLAFMAGIYKMDNIHGRVENMIERVGLGVEAHKKIGTLSKGYRQRVGLAQALIHDPQVLILDEPTSGLDPNQLIEIRSLIQDMGKEKTVMFSTHIMQEVEAICSRAIIINKGKLIAVVGCGGDRDKGKRPLMGQALKNHADVAIFTSDNPRSEEPQAIMKMILAGIDQNSSGVQMIVDRAAAIMSAVRHAATQDIVLVAGKGHETTQDINGKKFDFSDQEHIRLAAGGGI